MRAISLNDVSLVSGGQIQDPWRDNDIGDKQDIFDPMEMTRLDQDGNAGEAEARMNMEYGWVCRKLDDGAVEPVAPLGGLGKAIGVTMAVGTAIANWWNSR